MSHHTHFLSRLERASQDEITFAMSLYYDSTFTREIIRLFTLPDNAERLAIELSDGNRPSHAILARNGAFVTCLAPGMKLGDIPVITQHQFTGLTRQHEKIVERQDEIRALIDKNPDASPVKQTLFNTGRNLTREHFKNWTLFQPLLLINLVETHLKGLRKMAQLTEELQPVYRKGKIRNKRERQSLRKLWEVKWSAANLTMLIFSDTSFTNKMPNMPWGEMNYGTVCLMDKVVPMSLMGLWYVAKMGKYLFPFVKKTLLDTKNPRDYLDSTLMLIAIASRHNRYKGEVIKLLNRNITGMSEYSSDMCKSLRNYFSKCFYEQETVLDMAECFMEMYFEAEYKKYCNRTIINEIPTHLKILFLGRNENHFLDDHIWMTGMGLLLPWVVRLEPEEFFIPQKYEELFYSYKPAQAMDLVSKGSSINTGVLKAGEKPGRNQPCHCGSRKKYKRCCFKKSKASCF